MADVHAFAVSQFTGGTYRVECRASDFGQSHAWENPRPAQGMPCRCGAVRFASDGPAAVVEERRA